MPPRKVLPAVVTLFFLALPVQAQTHFWDFNTSGIVNDLGTGPAASGTLFGGATVSGGVLNLDGSTGYVQFSSHLVPTVPSYSVTLFARAAAGANFGHKEFISQGFSGGPGFYIGLDFNGTNMRASDPWGGVGGAQFIADNTFHHYALTVSSTNAWFYIDGALMATRGSSFTTTAGGTATRLGKQFAPFSEYFNGALDDVRIYDRVLSSQEIDALADGPVTATPEPASILLLATGLMGVALITRRHRNG